MCAGTQECRVDLLCDIPRLFRMNPTRTRSGQATGIEQRLGCVIDCVGCDGQIEAEDRFAPAVGVRIVDALRLLVTVQHLADHRHLQRLSPGKRLGGLVMHQGYCERERLAELQRIQEFECRLVYDLCRPDCPFVKRAALGQFDEPRQVASAGMAEAKEEEVHRVSTTFLCSPALRLTFA